MTCSDFDAIWNSFKGREGVGGSNSIMAPIQGGGGGGGGGGSPIPKWLPSL